VVWNIATGKFHMTVYVTDFVTQKPFAGVTLKACGKNDPICAMAPTVVTDANGTAVLDVPAGFDGYVDGSGGGIYPFLGYVPFPVVVDRFQGFGVLTNATFAAFASLLGTPDPMRGHVALSALDCNGTPAAHVVFEASPTDSETIPFFLAGQLPTTNATETDARGGGGFGNLVPGVVTVRSKVPALGLKVHESTVLIRANTFTFKNLWPTP
jgi:hypothetical protein